MVFCATAAKMAALPVSAAKMAAFPVNAAKMAALHTGGSQFTATADSVATSCDPPTVGRGVPPSRKNGRGGVPSPPYLLSAHDVKVEGGIVFLPLYMSGLLAS